MNKLSTLEMTALEGGKCINREPGQGEEHSGVACPGMCYASVIVFLNTGHGLGSDGLVCIV